jgi:hypothetical protein
VEVDEDVRIAVARQAIAAIVPPEELERLESPEATADEEPAAEPVTAEEPQTAEERDAARS